jgi:hypothetical protein
MPPDDLAEALLQYRDLETSIYKHGRMNVIERAAAK